MDNEILNFRYTVMSYWLTKELTKRGFKCIGVGENVNKAGFKVFYFKDTEELREAIDEIKKEYHDAKIKKWKKDLLQSGKFYHRQKNRQGK